MFFYKTNPKTGTSFFLSVHTFIMFCLYNVCGERSFVMYVFRNAVRNISRVKVRNILIGIIIFIVAASSCVGLSIRNSSDKLIESYKNSNEIEATLILNRKSMM
mgnify:CR=1 FL=1